MLPFHPRLVHLPIALSVLMPLVTSGLLLAWLRGWLPRRTWAVAVLLQAALVAGGIAAIRSGEGDEHRAETVLSERLIHEHEDAAKLLTGVALLVLMVAGAGMFLRGETAARAAAGAAVVGTLAVLLLAYRAGELGGRLVYVHGAASAFQQVPGPPQVPARHEGD